MKSRQCSGLFVTITADVIVRDSEIAMAHEVKDTKFDEYLEFPCSFNFKILGVAHDNLVDHVMAVVRQHTNAGDYSPIVKPSSKGNYHSVTVSVTVTSKHHIELLYTELGRIELVRYVL